LKFECCSQCVTLTVGSNAGLEKTYYLPAAAYQCPAVANRFNWVNSATYGDQYAQTQSGTAVSTRRIDASNGWGINLQIQCCVSSEKRAIRFERTTQPCMSFEYTYSNSTMPPTRYSPNLIAGPSIDAGGPESGTCTCPDGTIQHVGNSVPISTGCRLSCSGGISGTCSAVEPDSYCGALSDGECLAAGNCITRPNGNRLCVQLDGNVVAYTASNGVIAASHTGHGTTSACFHSPDFKIWVGTRVVWTAGPGHGVTSFVPEFLGVANKDCRSAQHSLLPANPYGAGISMTCGTEIQQATCTTEVVPTEAVASAQEAPAIYYSPPTGCSSSRVDGHATVESHFTIGSECSTNRRVLSQLQLSQGGCGMGAYGRFKYSCAPSVSSLTVNHSTTCQTITTLDTLSTLGNMECPVGSALVSYQMVACSTVNGAGHLYHFTCRPQSAAEYSSSETKKTACIATTGAPYLNRHSVDVDCGADAALGSIQLLNENSGGAGCSSGHGWWYNSSTRHWKPLSQGV
jgi:hypothetical protein